MKKAFIAIGLAFVCFMAFCDWAQSEQKLKNRREEILAGNYK